jgi:hypothetical protein
LAPRSSQAKLGAAEEVKHHLRTPLISEQMGLTAINEATTVQPAALCLESAEVFHLAHGPQL